MRSSIQKNFIFLITISILCFSLKTTIMQFEYSFFNDVFTEQFCENKSKPELKCNGKCHLKKLNKEQDNQNSSKKTLTDSEVIFLNPTFNYNFSKIVIAKKKIIFAKKDLFKSDTYYQIKHPPQNLI